jgi:hypothetical protein
MVNATHRPLYPRERIGTNFVGYWVGPKPGLNRSFYLIATDELVFLHAHPRPLKIFLGRFPKQIILPFFLVGAITSKRAKNF